jgi:hypothetical protein
MGKEEMYRTFTGYELLALLLTIEYLQGNFGGEIWKSGGRLVFNLSSSQQ